MVNARAHGLLLVLMGTASLWFASGEQYALLMNPMFRWVTLTGAALVTVLGLALLRDGGRASRFAFVTFTLFFALVAWAEPHAGGVAPMLAPPESGPAVERDGYTPIRTEALFDSLDTEAVDVPEGKLRLRGFVKRLPALDARGEFILLEPMMACCLADAIALGIRVKSPTPDLPPDEAWVYAFGTLDPLDPPRPVPAFRVGAILFNAVSRTHQLLADEVVGYESLLPPLLDKIPADRCAFFLALLEVSGVAETIRGDGPFTVLAPVDAAFGQWTEAQRDEARRDPELARKVVSACILPGRQTTPMLHERKDPRIAPLDDSTHKHLTVISQNGRLEIGGARVLFGDMACRNGVLHLVHPAPSADP